MLSKTYERHLQVSTIARMPCTPRGWTRA